MKILYVGSTDILAKSIIDTFAKEDDSVYIISKYDFSKGLKPALKYKHFDLSNDYVILDETFLSINPDIIIYAGKRYLNDDWEFNDDVEGYSSQLSFWLEKSKLNKRFIYLSTTKIYGLHGKTVSEDHSLNPNTIKGLTIANGEDLVHMYEKQYDIKTAIIRCSDIYDADINVNNLDFLSRTVKKIHSNKTIRINAEEIIQPIHVNDVSNAIKRIIENGLRNNIYNLCSTKSIKLYSLYEFLIKKLDVHCNLEIYEGDASISFSNQKIKNDIEWIDFKDIFLVLDTYSFSNVFDNVDINKSYTKILGIKSKLGIFTRMSDFVRKIIEHSFILIVFCIIVFLTKDKSLFASIDLLTIYIVIIALSYGIYHTTAAIVFSGVIFLYSNSFSFLEIINFYSYVDIILKIIEYLVIGIFIAYIVDLLKEDIRIKSEEIEELKTEKNEIRAINNKNVLIKNEYEKRLLNTKNSLPKLYSVISRINILQPEKILYEILHVVSDLMETETVAVYMINSKSSYIRLTASLNDESIYRGKSWNLDDDEDIRDSLVNGNLYRGKGWDDKPAYVSPIMHNNACIAVIVIKHISFENQSLYQMNLLRTLTVLISNSVSKAMDYENNIYSNICIEGTDILIYDEFVKKVALSYEKQSMNLGHCCVVKCDFGSDDLNLYSVVRGMLRNTDILGLDSDGKLCILLGNETKQDGLYLIKRLIGKDINAVITEEFEYLGV